jgi:hypothetical protein
VTKSSFSAGIETVAGCATHPERNGGNYDRGVVGARVGSSGFLRGGDTLLRPLLASENEVSDMILQAGGIFIIGTVVIALIAVVIHDNNKPAF